MSLTAIAASLLAFSTASVRADSQDSDEAAFQKALKTLPGSMKQLADRDRTEWQPILVDIIQHSPTLTITYRNGDSVVNMSKASFKQKSLVIHHQSYSKTNCGGGLYGYDYITTIPLDRVSGVSVSEVLQSSQETYSIALHISENRHAITSSKTYVHYDGSKEPQSSESSSFFSIKLGASDAQALSIGAIFTTLIKAYNPGVRFVKEDHEQALAPPSWFK